MKTIIILISCCLANFASNAQNILDNTNQKERILSTSFVDKFTSRVKGNSKCIISQGVVRSFKIGTHKPPIKDEIPIEELKVTVYPNPISDKFQISLANVDSNVEIELSITNLYGRSVLVRTGSINMLKSELNLQNFKTGVYILLVKVGNQSARKILVKK